MGLLDTLLQNLHAPDPQVRAETLRILAMVEESRALSSVQTLAEHDPHPSVRQIAQWASGILHQAQAVSTSRLAPRVDENAAYQERRLLESLIEQSSTDQHTQNTLDLLRSEWERLDMVEKRAKADPAPRHTPFDHSAQDLDLLDKGLSAAFWQFWTEEDKP